MTFVHRWLPALALTAALAVAAPAAAGEPEPVTTSPPAATAAPGVSEQIDNYLKTSPALELPRDGATGVTSGSEPRKLHGAVDVTVGTGGYRSAYVRADAPLGERATASIVVGETRFGNNYAERFGGRFAPGVRQSLGLGLMFGGAGSGLADCRRVAAGENGAGLRRDPWIEDSRLRTCPAAEAASPPR